MSERNGRSLRAGLRLDEVPAGWTAARWAAECRRMAAACRVVNPAKATEYEERARSAEAAARKEIEDWQGTEGVRR